MIIEYFVFSFFTGRFIFVQGLYYIICFVAQDLRDTCRSPMPSFILYHYKNKPLWITYNILNLLSLNDWVILIDPLMCRVESVKLGITKVTEHIESVVRHLTVWPDRFSTKLGISKFQPYLFSTMHTRAFNNFLPLLFYRPHLFDSVHGGMLSTIRGFL